MKSSVALLSLAAAVPAAYGIAFAGPAPTDVSPDRVQVGSGPQPTKAPSAEELKKRQTNLNPNTCGWVDGDFDLGITCSVGRTCMLYKSASIGMAGCCAGSDTQECGWTDACVDMSQFAAGNCGENCLDNPFVRKCTDAAAPYCVTWTYPGDRVADYGCAATSSNTIYTVLQRATDSLSDTTRMTLPTLSGNAVTFQLINTETGTGSNTSPTDASNNDGSTNSGFNNGSTSPTVKKVAIGLIVGVVVAALAVIFFIVMGICCCLKRKKKQRLLAANTQTVAAAQANRPQSQFPPSSQQPQMHMHMQPPTGGYMPPPPPQQGGFAPPMSPQSPQPNGYFAPPPQHDQKYEGRTSVTEYAVTPISAPSTPAPQYAQPYAQSNVPAMPQQDVRAHYYNSADGAQALSPQIGSPQPISPPAQYVRPHDGAHEVDAISVPSPPQAAGQTSGPVYEMGTGK